MVRLLFTFLFVLLLAYSGIGQQLRITSPVRLLALGDSYTIGQSVAVDDRWPVQLADTLETLGFTIDEVKIVATTGWTTGNLLNALNNDPPETDYSLVSLLIGVNNQYQGGSIETYSEQFEELLNRAIQHAGGDASRVVVLSIPDYAFTPFGMNLSGISEEIDEFNAVNESITAEYNVPYINITDISRRGLDEPELVASDGLHPSGQMYSLWVRRIVEQADLEVVSSVSSQGIRQEDVLIYPNPVQELLNINMSVQVRVLDLYGNERIGSANCQACTLDVRGLFPGIYILEISGKETLYFPLVKL